MSSLALKSLFLTLSSLNMIAAIPQAPYAENKPVAGEQHGRPPQVDGQGALPVADEIGEVYTSSFTYNMECTGPTMACGPNWNNDPSGGPGSLEPNLDNANVGMAAVNSWLYYNNWNGPNANLNKGWGGGCGQCWELTPKQEYNWHNIQPVAQLLPVGKPIIVTVTDICTDGGTGDEQPGSLNGWGMEVHFDICRANNHVWKDFFGNGTNGNGNIPGQIIGSAKRVQCPAKVPKFGSSCTSAAYAAKPDNCPPPGSNPPTYNPPPSHQRPPASHAATHPHPAQKGHPLAHSAPAKSAESANPARTVPATEYAAKKPESSAHHAHDESEDTCET